MVKDWFVYVIVKIIECFSNCDSGCFVVVCGGVDCWIYVYGNFIGVEDVDFVYEGFVKYVGIEDGFVFWCECFVYFCKNCIVWIFLLCL